MFNKTLVVLGVVATALAWGKKIVNILLHNAWKYVSQNMNDIFVRATYPCHKMSPVLAMVFRLVCC